MKTTNHIAVFATAVSIVFSASAYASPPGKGTRFGAYTKSMDTPKVERKVEHKSMKHVGPPGKGYICRR